MVKASKGKSDDSASRRPGRPAGNNRTPLSKDERRSRHAQYERKRRIEFAQAFFELAEAAGCAPYLPQAELLIYAANYIRTSAEGPANEIRELENQNQALKAQLTTLIHQLYHERFKSIPSTSDVDVKEFRRPEQSLLKRKKHVEGASASTHQSRKARFPRRIKRSTHDNSF